MNEFLQRTFKLIGLPIVALLTLCATVEAQKFDLEAYLKKKDTNRNGRVEPEEMSDNTKGFLSKMGFDSSKSISIKKIVSKVNNDRQDANAKKSQASRERKVPGFGVEKTTESTGVARFGSSGSASASASKSPKLSESVLKRVEETLQRYDRDKDGTLDRNEISRARWGSPPPEQSDSNKDGRLSKTELGNRYASREQYYRTTVSTSTSSDKARELAKKKAAEYKAKRDKEKQKSRSTSRYSSPSTTRSSYTPRTTKTTSSGSSASSQAKYEKYAESLIKQYDENKDGKLSKEETSKMRRPPAGADADKDGVITKSELVSSLDETNNPKTKPSAASSTGNDKKRIGRDRDSSKGSSSYASRRSGTSSSFETLDVNADQHVQMHEYSKEWSDQKVEEFYEKDKNRDGVITLREWAEKN